MSLTVFLGVGSFALLVLGMIVGAAGRQYGSYLCRASQTERVFRKPFTIRIGGAIMGLGLLLLPLVFVGLGKGLMAFYLLLCVPVAVLILMLSRPSELQLNLVERTYRRINGWPFFSSTQSGALADMGGVYVSVTVSDNGSRRYSVGIRGKRFGVMYLGRFEAKAAAEQFAQELMSELSLPPALSP